MKILKEKENLAAICREAADKRVHRGRLPVGKKPVYFD